MPENYGHETTFKPKTKNPDSPDNPNDALDDLSDATAIAAVMLDHAATFTDDNDDSPGFSRAYRAAAVDLREAVYRVRVFLTVAATWLLVLNLSACSATHEPVGYDCAANVTSEVVTGVQACSTVLNATQTGTVATFGCEPLSEATCPWDVAAPEVALDEAQACALAVRDAVDCADLETILALCACCEHALR